MYFYCIKGLNAIFPAEPAYDKTTDVAEITVFGWFDLAVESEANEIDSQYRGAAPIPRRCFVQVLFGKHESNVMRMRLGDLLIGFRPKSAAVDEFKTECCSRHTLHSPPTADRCAPIKQLRG